MTIAESFLAELEQESKATRKALERLPNDKLGWRPHDSSMSAGQLALHIATSPAQVLQLALQDEVPAPDFNRTPPQPENAAEVLEAFDQSVATVRRELPAISDAQMLGTWKATMNGKEILSMPRVAFLRSIMLNHLYHHRGQFGVYLRLLGVKVPSTYGPSADELPDFVQSA